jgi:thermostable 8-oxoguanine DNA glycosylase
VKIRTISAKRIVKTIRDKKAVQTQISATDRQKLGRVIDLLSPLVQNDWIGEIGKYDTITADELWFILVVQFCVIGSAERIERIKNNPDEYEEFKKAVSFSVLTEQVARNQQKCLSYLSEKLIKATRFYNKRAIDLLVILNSSTVFRNGKVVLFDGLSHTDDVNLTRDEIVKRCPGFNLKSASDFMISVGLSHNVIALDTRVIGFLRKYLDYDDVNVGYIQGNREYYFSLEAALREFCLEKGISLALLDRVIFNFSGLNLLGFLIDNPTFPQKSG